MAGIRVIITGATGMVGEGVLLECLGNPEVSEVLIVNRRHYELQHPKLNELVVPDFFKLSKFSDQLQDYDACFFCAGISSVGMKEEKFTHITYDTTIAFASALLAINKNMTFIYVSGKSTDSTEKGNVMWARVKGRTENRLAAMGFKAVYNFRPGVMLPFEGQKNWKTVYKWIAQLMRVFSPDSVLPIAVVAKAMIRCVTEGYTSTIVEVEDIRRLGG